ncbi:hypothetical protein AMATHDRAFT_72631 [Amanita thiersii Skay4041]|uniref:CP-type G domain-containing protein n=1 Tax=Amanita thiersii Skay4041 TaxID=703135 RepID=A0A2A9P1S8_9AGAR|nr:hypothetical protein AMATHDRAFT_72631 [Amanita thiersii Skay4041]
MAAPKGKDHNSSGLGRAIINQKVRDARKANESGLFTTDIDPSARLRSVTQEGDLDEFFSTAQLAGIDFAAERRNTRIVQNTANTNRNPYLLSEQEERVMIQKHEENKSRLQVPRRPPWTKSMAPAEVDRQEKAAFLDWRRSLAQLQEQDKFLLTPFERNIEVWRQLWRVLERSHLIVQIVDARNPLRFRCQDLESYVHDIEGTEGEMGTGKGKRLNLLLINKADLLTAEQRQQWADYFEQQKIEYVFYSAASAMTLQQALPQPPSVASPENSTDLPIETLVIDESNSNNDTKGGSLNIDSAYSKEYLPAEERENEDTRTRILSVNELEQLFLEKAPDLSVFAQPSGQPASKLIVGLVGYPNVGKSSTINSLLGEKRVSVSSTPGKTKHFQTIPLSNYITLCDCPGLVFPQFATTRADLVCDGVLPIDQLREHTGPISLLVQRIHKSVLEATYGLSIKVKTVEDGGDGQVTAENFLKAYAIARGFMRAGQGNPDEARAARYVLKDYVNGKLLYCHPPPGTSAHAFNKATHDLCLLRAIGKKHAPMTRVSKKSDTFVALDSPALDKRGASVMTKSRVIDQEFFEPNSLSYRPRMSRPGKHEEFTRPRFYPHQNVLANDGTPLNLNQVQTEALLNNGKKHHNKLKRNKQRSGKGYGDE